MLPKKIIPINFGSFHIEPWGEYKKRIRVSGNEAEAQFYRQVIYDHFDHFDEHYPWFKIEEARFEWLDIQAKDVDNSVKFFQGESLGEMWQHQIEEFSRKKFDYIIHREMLKNFTFPFPPILIDSTSLRDVGWRKYGHPIHLIEGTHRTSYLINMVKMNLISPSSTHRFVIVRPIKSSFSQVGE